MNPTNNNNITNRKEETNVYTFQEELNLPINPEDTTLTEEQQQEYKQQAEQLTTETITDQEFEELLEQHQSNLLEGGIN